jgi:hypothetical protein
MAQRGTSTGFSAKILFGFVAGFFATLIFHQLTLAVLWGAGLAPFGPYSTAPTPTPSVFLRCSRWHSGEASGASSSHGWKDASRARGSTGFSPFFSEPFSLRW